MSKGATIEAMNLAIAEFMGLEKDRHAYLTGGRFITKYLVNGYWLPLRKLKYHTSWDWLKPVIDKIFEYAIAYLDQVKPIIEMSIVVNIQSAHEKVYEFCKWLNQQLQTNDTVNG